MQSCSPVQHMGSARQHSNSTCKGLVQRFYVVPEVKWRFSKITGNSREDRPHRRARWRHRRCKEPRRSDVVRAAAECRTTPYAPL